MDDKKGHVILLEGSTIMIWYGSLGGGESGGKKGVGGGLGEALQVVIDRRPISLLVLLDDAIADGR